jgi:superoxide reductase
MKNIIFYRCNTCGNIMALLKNAGESRICCEQSMTKLEPNTSDGAKEKHIPIVTKATGKLQVAVGSVSHPMLPEHYIELIAVDSDKKTDIVYLAPGMEPKAEFGDAASGTVYAYCSVHGLWKADF